MILAGSCLLNNNKKEIDNAFETAAQLKLIDTDIVFRCKLFGGGSTPDRWAEGIGIAGLPVFYDIARNDMNIATEIRDTSRLDLFNESNFVTHYWIAARCMWNYDLLDALKGCNKPVIVKRNYGATIQEAIGIYDVVNKNTHNDVYLCFRGINTFDRREVMRWRPDVLGMAEVIHTRPDIPVMLDASHSVFNKDYILPMCKAAKAVGVDNFMIETYADPTATQSDREHAINIEEFKAIYEYIK